MMFIKILTLYLLLSPALSTCICDITTLCDSKCCCDSTCSSSVINYWTTYNLCYPNNPNGLNIPICSQTNSIQIGDLHSGLRTIYTIIKNLFCIAKVNTDLTFTYNSLVDTTNSQVKTTINNLFNSYSQTTMTDPRAQFKTLTNYSVPMFRSDGRCVSSSLTYNIDVPYFECRSSTSSNLLTISTYTNLFPSSTVTVYYRNGTSNTTSVTTTLSSLTNIVRYVNFQLTTSGSSVTSANVEITIDQSTSLTTSTIYQGFQYTWVTNSSTYTQPSTVGYAYGAPLVFASGTTLLPSPLQLSFSINGACISDNTTIYYNNYQIRFGVDAVISCAGSFSGNLHNNITKVAKIGGASLSNGGDFLDFSMITASTSTITFTYSRIGKQQNNMFIITSAKMAATSYYQSTVSQSSIFIEFKSVVNPSSIYIPSAPSPNVYLSNDVLYPFYVY